MVSDASVAVESSAAQAYPVASCEETPCQVSPCVSVTVRQMSCTGAAMPPDSPMMAESRSNGTASPNDPPSVAVRTAMPW